MLHLIGLRMLRTFLGIWHIDHWEFVLDNGMKMFMGDTYIDVLLIC